MSEKEFNINSHTYLNKYLKYKLKYTRLKNNLSDLSDLTECVGVENENGYANGNKDEINLKGGAIPFFYEQNEIIKRINLLENNKQNEKGLHQFSRIYLKANITNKKIIRNYDKIRKIILKNDTPPPFLYHLTLLIFDVNLDYPVLGNIISQIDTLTGRKKIKKDLSFLDINETKTDFEIIFKNMVLKTIEHEVLGKLSKIKTKTKTKTKTNTNIEIIKEIDIGVKNPYALDCLQYPGNYFVDKFEINNKNLINCFRTKFYDRLNEFVKLQYIKNGGKEKDYVGWRADVEIDPEYILIFYDNFSTKIPLLAIHKFYYGKNTWIPHISIFNMEELEQNNLKFLSKYAIDFLTWHSKTHTDKLLFAELNKSKTVKNSLKLNMKKEIVLKDFEFTMQI